MNNEYVYIAIVIYIIATQLSRFFGLMFVEFGVYIFRICACECDKPEVHQCEAYTRNRIRFFILFM